MPKFEYLFVDTHGSITAEKLNQLGEMGWVFCALYRERQPTFTNLFYREISEFTKASRPLVGEIFTLEQDADGLVWAFPDGSHTDLYVMGHNIAQAQLLFDRNLSRLGQQWSARKAVEQSD